MIGNIADETDGSPAHAGIDRHAYHAHADQ